MADGEKKGGIHWGTAVAGVAVGVVVGGGLLLVGMEATDHVREGAEHDAVKALMGGKDGDSKTVNYTRAAGKVVVTLAK